MSDGCSWKTHFNKEGVKYHDLCFPRFPFPIGWVTEYPPKFKAVSMAIKIETQFFDDLESAKAYLISESMMWLLRLGDKDVSN